MDRDRLRRMQDYYNSFSFSTLLKVLSKDECEKSFDLEQIAKSGIPKFIIDQQFPDGIKKELACVDNHLHVEKACQVINHFKYSIRILPLNF